MRRWGVPDRETLDRLVRESLPRGWTRADLELDVFRDVYFDTPEEALRRSGREVRLRVRGDGARILQLRLPQSEEKEPRSLPMELDGHGVTDLLQGESRAAELVRERVDPEMLAPSLELEFARRRCTGHADGDPPAAATFTYDAVTARGDGIAEIWELRAALPAEGATPVAGLLAEWERIHALRPVSRNLARRARQALARSEGQPRSLERALRSARKVAVLPYRDGRVGLRRDGEGLRVPVGEGSGEAAVRRLLRDHFGDSEGSVRALGTSPGSAAAAAVEVWLAEEVAQPEAADSQVVWMPLSDVLARVGSPALQDPPTLAALHVATRSGLATGARGTIPGDRNAISSAGGRPFRLARDHELVQRGTEPLAESLPRGSLLNMELSLLAFNRRVLALAETARTPLLERVRFLSIFSANLDEFFRVRVAGFKRQVASRSTKRTLDGVGAGEQLDAIGIRARRLTDRAHELLREGLLPGLEEEGIRIRRPAELDEGERAALKDFYVNDVHPLLTPLAAGPGHPFPRVRNLRPALLVVIRSPEDDREDVAVIEIPGHVRRFVPLSDGETFVLLEHLIVDNLQELYADTEVLGAYAFRVTRSAALQLEQESIRDVLHAVEDEVRRRRFRAVVRLEVEESMPEELRRFLLHELQFESSEQVSALTEGDIYAVDWLIDLRALGELAALPRPELHYPPLEQRQPLPAGTPVLEALQEDSLLVEFPRDSFEATVGRFIAEAADDPDVLAIKLALYRTDRESRIVEALRRASANGKQVVAVVELTARFDEQHNIDRARHLEEAGIHVIYGIPGLKIHAKIALVARREGDGLRRYVYIGTGNLNAATAAAYTDLGLLSADPALGHDLNDLFNVLTGYAGQASYQQILVSPSNMRQRFLQLIDREAEHAREGRGGHIRAKFNGLADREMIAALYRASQAGVKIELIVRSLCALRPGVEGLSENVRVWSILGRFLEHSRIFRFGNAGEPEYWIGSADWRTRNLSRRVEVVTPIHDPVRRERLDAIMAGELADPDAWELGSDGTYYQRPERAPRAGDVPAEAVPAEA
ncbi:hypothetical protein BH23GEM4_BH23GEM4_10910 [soil metagenome]